MLINKLLDINVKFRNINYLYFFKILLNNKFKN